MGAGGDLPILFGTEFPHCFLFLCYYFLLLLSLLIFSTFLHFSFAFLHSPKTSQAVLQGVAFKGVQVLR